MKTTLFVLIAAGFLLLAQQLTESDFRSFWLGAMGQSAVGVAAFFFNRGDLGTARAPRLRDLDGSEIDPETGERKGDLPPSPALTGIRPEIPCSPSSSHAVSEFEAEPG